MNEIPEPIRRSLLDLYGISGYQCIGNGLSGARVFQAVSTDGEFCLRRWPQGTTSNRVSQVRRFMTIAHVGACAFVPQIFPIGPRDIAVAGAHVWDLSQWMPGRFFRDGELSTGRIAAAVAAIAAVHHAVADETRLKQPAPAAVKRIQRIDELNTISDFRDVRIFDPEFAELARQIGPIWIRCHPSIRFRLTESIRADVDTQWVMRDVHREHVLWQFDADNEPHVSGIIDYDAVQIDTPAADVARFLGSCPLMDADTYDSAVEVYNQQMPSATIDPSFVRLLDQATCLIAAINWLVWLGLEEREFAAGRQKPLDRFTEVVERAKILFP